MPVDQSDLAATYYKHLHSEYNTKFSCLSYIKLAIDTLKQHNIPFVMTYMDNLLFDQRWHISPGVIHLQSYVKPHMIMFNQMTFLEWSRHGQYAESPAWHPLEEAHQAAFDLIKVTV